GDGVAIFHKSERAADVRLGRDVTDDEPVAAAGEAAVGDQSDVFAQTFAHDGGGWRKHFAHAGSTERSFEADDDDVTFDNGAVEDFFESSFFGVEYASLASEAKAFFAGNFGDGTFGSEIAIENDEVAVLFYGLIERLNDGLAIRVRLNVAESFGHGLAG